MNTFLILLGFTVLGVAFAALSLWFAMAMCARDFDITIREQIRRLDAADYRFIRRLFATAAAVFFVTGVVNAGAYNSPKPDPLGEQIGTADNGWRVFRTPHGKVYAIPPKEVTK